MKPCHGRGRRQTGRAGLRSSRRATLRDELLRRRGCGFRRRGKRAGRTDGYANEDYYPTLGGCTQRHRQRDSIGVPQAGPKYHPDSPRDTEAENKFKRSRGPTRCSPIPKRRRYAHSARAGRAARKAFRRGGRSSARASGCGRSPADRRPPVLAGRRRSTSRRPPVTSASLRFAPRPGARGATRTATVPRAGEDLDRRFSLFRRGLPRRATRVRHRRAGQRRRRPASVSSQGAPGRTRRDAATRRRKGTRGQRRPPWRPYLRIKLRPTSASNGGGRPLRRRAVPVWTRPSAARWSADTLRPAPFASRRETPEWPYLPATGRGCPA